MSIHSAITKRNETAIETTGLVDAPTLIKTLWPECPPSLRFIRELQAKRAIPYLKISRKVFFNPVKVKAALEKRYTVEAS
jgi:hypothetical protein